MELDLIDSVSRMETWSSLEVEDSIRSVRESWNAPHFFLRAKSASALQQTIVGEHPAFVVAYFPKTSASRIESIDFAVDEM